MKRWLVALILGSLLSASLFLLVAWIQPSLGGNERMEISSSLRLVLQGPRVDRGARKKGEAADKTRKEDSSAAKRSAPKKVASARSTAAAKAEARATSNLRGDLGRNLIVAPLALAAVGGSGGPSFQAILSEEDSAVLSQMKDFKEYKRRREEAIANPGSGRRGGTGAGGKGAGGRASSIEINVGRSGSQNYIPQPRYPEKARKDQLQGFVEVQILISITGTVLKHEITGAQPLGVFEQAVVDILPECRFQPALDETGKPIEYWDTYRFNFELKNMGV